MKFTKGLFLLIPLLFSEAFAQMEGRDWGRSMVQRYGVFDDAEGRLARDMGEEIPVGDRGWFIQQANRLIPEAVRGQPGRDKDIIFRVLISICEQGADARNAFVEFSNFFQIPQLNMDLKENVVSSCRYIIRRNLAPRAFELLHLVPQYFRQELLSAMALYCIGHGDFDRFCGRFQENIGRAGAGHREPLPQADYERILAETQRQVPWR